VMGLPRAPTTVIATGGDGKIGVTWGAPAAGSADLHAVWIYDAAGYVDRYAVVCGTCTSATVTGLANGRTYYTVVAAHNPAGWGATTSSAWVTVMGRPAAPTDLRLSSLRGQLTAAWTAPANTAAASVDSYMVVVYDTNGYSGRYVTVCGACASGTVTGLTNGAWYQVVVYAHNAGGWGDAAISGWAVVGAPTAPRDLRATPGNGQVGVSWSAPASDSGSPVTGYLLVVYDADGYTGRYATCGATCAGTVVTGLTNGRPYTVVVYASNAYGGGLSASAPVTPAA